MWTALTHFNIKGFPRTLVLKQKNHWRRATQSLGSRLRSCELIHIFPRLSPDLAICASVTFSSAFFHLYRCLLYLFLNRALFPKIDINNDKQVSMTELYGWIEQHMKKHVLQGTNVRLRELDTNEDGKVSWEEYRAAEYPPSIEKG